MAAKLPRLSPSGAKTITRCMTKWWFEKIGGRRPPTTPAQSIGLAIHERAENYIQTGEYGYPDDDPIVKLVVPGQKYLDVMRDGFLHRGGEVEKLYEVPKGEWPVPVFCRTDYTESGADPWVNDHKSTKDLYSQYIPTPFDLANPGPHGDQMLWYGYMEWRNDPNPPESYHVQHTYFSSVSPASRVVRVRTTWEKTMLVAKKFGEIANTMYDAAQVLQPEQLEFNLDACSDYRGCPHATYCPHLQDRVGGLSRLRGKLKRKSRGEPAPQQQEKPTMGFRDRKKKELAAAKAAEEAEAPVPGEGQGNPPDTPGTEDPTEAQLEEIGDAILDELGPEAGNAEITEWLTGEGNEVLVRVGLGRPHVARILKFWSGDVDADDEAGEELPPEPTETDDLVDQDENPVVNFIRNQDGKVKVDDKDLAKVIREVTGAGRLTNKARITYLGTLQDQGLLDFNAVWVFLPEHSEELGAPADGPAVGIEVPATSKAPAAGSSAAHTEAKPDLQVVKDEGTNGVSAPAARSGLTFLIGCLPEGAYHETIDALLEEYYDVAHGAAVDEKGNKVGDLLLWAFGKGPPTVAAMVRADVREGKMPPVNGFVFVPKDHFMARHVSMMFPDAPVIRGV